MSNARAVVMNPWARDVTGANRAARVAEVIRVLGEQRPVLSIYLGAAPEPLPRLHALMEKGAELLENWGAGGDGEAMLRPIAALVRSEGLPPGAVAFLRSPDSLVALRLEEDVPDTVVVGTRPDMTPIARMATTIWRSVVDDGHRSARRKSRPSAEILT